MSFSALLPPPGGVVKCVGMSLLGAEVGVVRRPASHDFLVVKSGGAILTNGARRNGNVQGNWIFRGLPEREVEVEQVKRRERGVKEKRGGSMG